MAEQDFDRTDPVIAKVRETLAPMPRVDASDVARMLAAVHGRRRTLRERIAERIWFMRIPSVSMVGAATLAVLALSVGYLGRGMIVREVPANNVALTQDVGATNAVEVIDSAGRAIPVASTAVEDMPCQRSSCSTSAMRERCRSAAISTGGT